MKSMSESIKFKIELKKKFFLIKKFLKKNNYKKKFYI